MADPVSGATGGPGGPLRLFADLPDPRAANVRHRLADVLVIALCAVICDADGWDDFEDFAKAKAHWLSTFLDLSHGVPSADTFRRVLSRLDPDAFEKAFAAWMARVVELSEGKLVSIDGKSVRRSFERSWDKSGMAHMVGAFVHHNGLAFAQVKTQGKGQELAGIAQLLGLLDLKGATVTIDAIATHKPVAQQILDRGGQYILCVKENQPTLRRDIQVELDDMIRHDFHGLPFGHHRETDAGHGRIETREAWATDRLDWLGQAGDWPGLRSVAVVESTRDCGVGGVGVERRYYITSLPADAGVIAAAVRGHWAIENGLHHVLDVSFHEDDSRVRTGHGPENLARLRRLALNLLRTHGDKHSKRKSIRGRRKVAAWDHDFLLKLIAG
ncbi:MAG: ISAs1 family transposase [Planctomycetota bacterium]|nr:ISAs1 family transposase [Planctomycetota bacterium]